MNELVMTHDVATQLSAGGTKMLEQVLLPGEMVAKVTRKAVSRYQIYRDVLLFVGATMAWVMMRLYGVEKIITDLVLILPPITYKMMYATLSKRYRQFDVYTNFRHIDVHFGMVNSRFTSNYFKGADGNELDESKRALNSALGPKIEPGISLGLMPRSVERMLEPGERVLWWGGASLIQKLVWTLLALIPLGLCLGSVYAAYADYSRWPEHGVQFRLQPGGGYILILGGVFAMWFVFALGVVLWSWLVRDVVTDRRIGAAAPLRRMHRLMKGDRVEATVVRLGWWPEVEMNVVRDGEVHRYAASGLNDPVGVERLMRWAVLNAHGQAS